MSDYNLAPLDHRSRSAEAEAFLTAAHDLPPTALTSCNGWDVHFVAAHVAASYDEAARHVEAYGEGDPLTRTRTFEEREPPYREMRSSDLLAHMEQAEQRMRRAVLAVLTEEPDAELWWTNRMMRVDAFLYHLRNECAIHRWDMVGDDETSRQLLSQPDLFTHSVRSVGAGPLCARGLSVDALRGRPLTANVRTEGQPDLVVHAEHNRASFDLRRAEGDALVEGDQAARLLMLWGRKPSPPTRLVALGPDTEVERLQRLLSGY